VGLFSGKRPTDLGVRNGRLKPVPDTPNAVSSQAQSPTHAVAPLAYRGTREAAMEALAHIVAAMPGATIIVRDADYLYAEFESAWMGFVDDVEFHLPVGERLIHVRSASRLGRSDLGVNRRRVEDIRARLAASGV
jgi:uncharacterized protein (DUF1499 family)